jgi:DNA polymerase III epsilon subunit-like protein
MNTNTQTNNMNVNTTTKTRVCGLCKGSGHDRRNCPQRQNEAVVEELPQPSPPTQPVENPVSPTVTTNEMAITRPQIHLDRLLYFVFDLETTGFVPSRDEIIEIAGYFLGPDKVLIENGVYESLIHPNNKLKESITAITGLTNEMLIGKPSFELVAKDLIGFIHNIKSSFEEENNVPIEYVILVAHNGKRFDIPFLFHHFEANRIEIPSYLDTFALDTMHLASRSIAATPGADVPINYKLKSLYSYVTGGMLLNAHRASSDARATVTVLQHALFWDNRGDHMFLVRTDDNLLLNNEYDSDEVDDQDDASSVESEHNSNETEVETVDENEENLEVINGNSGDRWIRNGTFDPSVDSIGTFDIPRLGLRVSPSIVNTPIRSWRQIFTNHLLNTIVKYTNEYGELNCKSWVPIDTDDLTDFISVLFLMSIQKRKDKPSNWFSDDPFLECPQAKRIMSGKQFAKMLRYLHCCPVTPPEGAYDPIYKVSELMDYILKRSQVMFEPGKNLSLDETLIRTFGRIKFKVRIISKSARYGIKIYVVTDASTAYVLNMIVYTGKDMNDFDDGSKKTVSIVKKLLEKYVNTYRHVYVDRFYTSFDLLTSLASDGIKLTGTVMSNRLPIGLRIPKNSKTFKEMNRGDAFRFKLVYKDGNDDERTAGLVAWKDSSMVYCLSNGCDNFTFDCCRRRSSNGPIDIPRPTVIGDYNVNMGGVDLADFRRLQCNSTIMGQKRWWLKLFFYLLDVGTSNALVLYNQARPTHPPINIAEFKKLIVEHFVGNRIMAPAMTHQVKEHIAVRSENSSRLSCAYCSLHGTNSRTRFVCQACHAPLCCLGSGKSASDCFAKAHVSQDMLGLVLERAKAMKNRTTFSNRKRKSNQK